MSGLEFHVTPGEQNSATATIRDGVRFHSEGMYAGEASFVVAVDDQSGMAVMEFTLPNYGITIQRDADGTWKRKDSAAG